MALSARVSALQTNKADLIIAILGKTPEREEMIDFSIPCVAVSLSSGRPIEAIIAAPDK